MAEGSRVSDRFRELVQWMIDSDGRHGAKKRVAERLGIHPSEVSKIIKGERRVGEDLAYRAAKTIGLDLAYFTGSGSPWAFLHVPEDFELGDIRDGRDLKELRVRASAVADAVFRAGPAGFGNLPDEVRQKAIDLASEIRSAKILQAAEALLAMDMRRDPVRFDRALHDLALDLVLQIPDNSAARETLRQSLSRARALHASPEERDAIVGLLTQLDAEL